MYFFSIQKITVPPHDVSIYLNVILLACDTVTLDKINYQIGANTAFILETLK